MGLTYGTFIQVAFRWRRKSYTEQQIRRRDWVVGGSLMV
eukprot:gene6345-biopygen2044